MSNCEREDSESVVTEVSSLQQLLYEMMEMLNIMIVGGFPDDVGELEFARFVGK